jgi:hypothetical protein
MSTELRIANTAGGVAQAMPTAQSVVTTASGQPAPRVDLDPYPTNPSPFTPMAVTACCGPGLSIFTSFTSLLALLRLAAGLCLRESGRSPYGLA